MSTVSFNGGVLNVKDGTRMFHPTAEEVYAVVFENAAAIRGIHVSKDAFVATGLDYSAYPGDPVVQLTVDNIDNQPKVTCRLVAKATSFVAETPCHNGIMFDYAIHSGRWVPLPIGTLDAAREFLSRANIQAFGPLTLAQYLRVLRIDDLPITVEDCTGDALSASNVAKHTPGNLPATFNGTLYPYQSAGFHWLSFMSRNDLGAIIADEMGLGKTVQVICLLLESVMTARGPNLIVGPATILENWRRELHRFGPSLRVLVHSGPRRTGMPSGFSGVDVVLASFETTVADISLFRNLTWDILVLDEAQGIKNPQTKRSIQLRTLNRRCTVAVTGTPIENHLSDLWSIADFAVPSLLGSLSDFQRRHPDTLDGAALLEPLVSPVILRRTVADVGGDLPPRVDIPQPLEMDPASAEVYETLRTATNTTAGAALTSLMALRMFCTHPWLQKQFTQVADAASCSVKLRRLFEIVEEIVLSDGKALVFTSYQGAIDLIVSEVATRFQIPTTFIDGRVPVPDRQPKVDAFAATTGPSLLVLNPKAAGTGINITAANHVIHYNLEWNPAVEDQASARAHRRGQTRAVTIHRLFYINTVEDVINDRMIRKRAIAKTAVVGTDGEEQDVEEIIRALRVSPVNHESGK
jgi:SNF2 family DNA or RNA helicase